MNPRAAKATEAVLALAVLLLFAAGARALTVDLDGRKEEEAVSVGISGVDTNRIELPETIVNAFSSKESMDVKIVGRSVLVRSEDPAELIVLTEKRRLTLMLLPEDVPSRTVILRADGQAPVPGNGESAAATEEASARPYEKTIMDLAVSLLSKHPSGKMSFARDASLPGSLFVALFATARGGGFTASGYVIENRGKETARLDEGMLSAGPETAAVGIEKRTLLPGEASRAVVVRKGEAEE